MHTIQIDNPSGNFYLDYLRFTDTVARYPVAMEKPYLALGICDETCDELQRTTKAADTILELGDGNWYVARIAQAFDISYPLVIETAKRAYRGGELLKFDEMRHELSKIAGKIAGRVKKFIRDSDTWSEDKAAEFPHVLMQLLVDYVVMSMNLTDVLWTHTGVRNFDDVLMENVKKLGGRAVRGTLQGEGDHR